MGVADHQSTPTMGARNCPLILDPGPVRASLSVSVSVSVSNSVSVSVPVPDSDSVARLQQHGVDFHVKRLSHFRHARYVLPI